MQSHRDGSSNYRACIGLSKVLYTYVTVVSLLLLWKWGCLWLFCLVLELFFFYWVTLPRDSFLLLGCLAQVCVYLIVSCYALFSWYPGRSAFFFFWRAMKEECIWGREKVSGGGNERSGGNGNCGQNVLYERTIKTCKWKKFSGK